MKHMRTDIHAHFCLPLGRLWEGNSKSFEYSMFKDIADPYVIILNMLIILLNIRGDPSGDARPLP
jgi:hypothetical protein